MISTVTVRKFFLGAGATPPPCRVGYPSRNLRLNYGTGSRWFKTYAVQNSLKYAISVAEMMVGLLPGLQNLVGFSRVQIDAHSNPANGNKSGEYMDHCSRAHGSNR